MQKIIVQNIKGARASRPFPACIFFHVHCMAWLLKPTAGVNSAPQDPVPSGLCLSSPSGQGILAEAASLPLLQGRRRKPEDPASDSSFVTELEVSQWDGRKEHQESRTNPSLYLWALLVSLPFSQCKRELTLSGEIESFVNLCWDFFPGS